MSQSDTRRPETLALHGGRFRADPATGAVAVPIYLTTSYLFHDTGHAARLFGLQEVGFTYTRTGNPTRDAGERRLAALEGGAGSLIVASGTAAKLYSLLNLAQAGDNLVVAANSSDAAGLATTLARYEIEVRLVEANDPDNFRRASDASTRAYFGETVGSIDFHLLDIDRIASIGGQLGIPLIVDNSAAPVAVRPLDHGAAVVVYSVGSYVSGSAGVEAGAIVDGGRFPWADHPERCPFLTDPDDSYHGAIWTEVAASFNTPLAYLTRARMRLLRDLGACVSPYEVFHLIEGIETLPLRMRAQTEGAAVVAAYLRERDDIEDVRRARFADGAAVNGLVAFRPKGGEKPATAALSALRLINRQGGFGDTHSLASLPRDSAEGTILLSVGLEHPDDLIADLAQAFDVARKDRTDGKAVA